MSTENYLRTGCKDVFNAFLVNDAVYDGELEIPVILGGDYRPNKLIPFSKAISSNDYECWIHFYEDDVSFERVWRNPNRYIPIIRKFAGVISPDFSLYRDMPLVMQFWNIYRNHAIAHAFQRIGCNVIANIRFGDSRTFEECCLGIPHHSTIAVGSHGCLKNKVDRKFFVDGLAYVVNKVRPERIIVYGTAPVDIFSEYKNQGIDVLQFDSSFATSRRENSDGNG